MLFSARSTRGARHAPGLLLVLLTLGFSASAHASPPISTSELPATETPSTIVPPWERHQRRRQAERAHGHSHGHAEHDHEREVRRSAGAGVSGEGVQVGGREGHRSAPSLSSEARSVVRVWRICTRRRRFLAPRLVQTGANRGRLSNTRMKQFGRDQPSRFMPEGCLELDPPWHASARTNETDSTNLHGRTKPTIFNFPVPGERAPGYVGFRRFWSHFPPKSEIENRRCGPTLSMTARAGGRPLRIALGQPTLETSIDGSSASKNGSAASIFGTEPLALPS